jgi:hypothetical protein
MERWFLFTAYNSQPLFGFGTEQEADAYCDVLNRKRGVNQYHYRAMSGDEAQALDSGRDTDGFRLDDEIATQAENDEWARTQPWAVIA